MLLPDTRHSRRQRDIAYLCLLPAGLLFLLSGMASSMPLGTGTAGGVGLMLLVPLSLLALAGTAIGLVRYIGLWRLDPWLALLGITTVAMLVQLFAEWGPVMFRNWLALAYGVGAIAIQAGWFLFRRRHLA